MGNSLDTLKMNLREREYPMLSDDELINLLKRNNQDVGAASYEGLILKSENTAISISGFSYTDTSNYFLRLARLFEPNNSGVLGG